MKALFEDTTNRDPLDFNRTPAWVVELLIPELGQPKAILDAGTGDGAIGAVLREAFPAAGMIGVEIDRDRWRKACNLESLKHGSVYDCMEEGDWLNLDPALPPSCFKGSPDLIISNPPFGLLALDFLRVAVRLVGVNGTVAFLLPTHWDHDPDAKTDYARQRFLDSIRLSDGREGYTKLAIVGGGPNPCRPAFRGGSNTATDRYAWFMFGDRWAGQPSRRLHAIPPAVENAQVTLL